jgi:hypothetical protein
MILGKYIFKVIKKFKNTRVVRKTENLLKKIVEKKTTKLWSISDNKNEFDRSKRLIE